MTTKAGLLCVFMLKIDGYRELDYIGLCLKNALANKRVFSRQILLKV